MTQIIKDLKAHYEAHEVPFGRSYEWHTEQIMRPLTLRAHPGATTTLRRATRTVNEFDQSVAVMVDKVLERQAKVRAAWTRESFEEALEFVLGTKAGRQLRELGSGPHRDERAAQWQNDLARKRGEERQRARQEERRRVWQQERREAQLASWSF